MPKTLKSQIFDAETRQEYWRRVKTDPEALCDRQKTAHEAECLEQYFEGVADGLRERCYLLEKG